MEFEAIFDNIIPNKEETVKRFSGNLALLEKFVRKFPNDENWAKLKATANDDNWAEMEVTAHTLKGYAGNMGFAKLYDACCEIVKAIREKDFDKAKSFMAPALDAGAEIEAFVAQLA
mgnify:CR=1 FL=1